MLSTASGGDRKRRRIAIACNECRDRKRKCDGVKPVCGSCARRAPSAPCIWEEGRNARGWSHSYVQSLRSRIQHLEGGQAADENGNNAPSRADERRCSEGGCAVSGTASPRRVMPQENEEYGLELHEQSKEQPEIIDVLSGTRIRALSTDRSLTGSTGRDSGNRTTSVLVDPNSVTGGEAEDDCGIDAMGVFGSISDRDGNGHEFLGPSSTLRFLSHAGQAMSQSTAIANGGKQRAALLGIFKDEGISVRGGSHPSQEPARASINLGGHHLSIPPKAQADALLDSYWTYFHSLYPVLHHPSFTERYLTLWDSPSCQLFRLSHQLQPGKRFYTSMGERQFHCLLNLAFALGSQFSPSVSDADRREVGLIFFKRAKFLTDFDLLARGDIFLVQILLLLGHYLQSTDMASACWNMVGLAIRVAQGIGLHHEPDYCEQGCCLKGRLSQLETEMRRRAWTNCILLDRVLSMTYGRPLMIHPAVSQHSIPPSAIDDEVLNDDPTAPAAQPQDLPSLMECYIQATKLQRILGEVLYTLYPGSGDKESGEINFNFIPASTAKDTLRRDALQMLLNIDKSLLAWEQDLPDYLQARSYNFMGFGANSMFGPRTPAFNRQAIILHARYLHIRLIMFRPVLSVLFNSGSKNTESEQDSSMKSAMRQGMLDKGFSLCVSSARDLVDLITGNLDLCNGVLPPSWHNVFYMHSCSIVLLLSRLCCLSHIQNKQGLTTSWNKCVSFFRTYQSRSRSAKRCLRILEAIQKRVFLAQPHLDPNPGLASGGTNNRGSANPEYQQTQGDYDWDENIPLQDQERSPPFFDEAMLANEATAYWISDPSEMNWLSVFPFLEGVNDGIPET
ncbi:fungal-specific transcription factor domain-containing protein [Aspergillus insuetus]